MLRERSRSLCTCGPVLVIAAGALAAPVRAQEPTQDTAQAAPACDGRPVSEIEIRREPPRIIGKSAPRWARPILGLLLAHRTTEASAVEPFLLLTPGGRCTEFRRAESERLLRAQPYLADATVRSTPDTGGGVRIEVATEDEVPLIIRGRLRATRPTALTIGNGNLLGRGIYAAARWRDGSPFRDGAAVWYTNYHALGGPNRFVVELIRDPLGETYRGALTRPYLTQFQSVAWHAGFAATDGYVGFARPEDDWLSLRLQRSLYDAGALVRMGPRGRRAFGGVTLAHERVTPGASGVVISDLGIIPDPDPELRERFERWHSTRVGAVLGTRLLSFGKLAGLDTLTGAQDVATGVQVATTLGKEFGEADDQPFGALDLYTAAGSSRSLVALRAQVERLSSRHQVGSARLGWYAKPSPRRTHVVSVEYAGASPSRLPYQLGIGDRRGGLRGYRGSRVAGARRGVLRLEERLSFGGVTRYAVLGAAGFTDVGRTWGGAVPFGVTSDIRASVGLSLLATVPQRSRRLYRLDIAVPVVRDRHAKWALQIVGDVPFRALWSEPADVGRARVGTPAAQLLNWQ